MTGPVGERLRTRVAVLGVLVSVLFGLLFTRLWFLQVLAGEQYAQAARRNHVRIISVEAPRGRILDRNGAVIVGNRPSLVVGIRRDDVPKDKRAFYAEKKRLAAMLGITLERINKRLRDKRVSPYKAVPIAEDVPERVFSVLQERADEFPGMETSIVPVRTYPKGTLAAHIVGYVGETNEAELDRLKAKGYRLGDSIGRTGVERTYEEWLRGRPGLDKLEVDASGRVLRSLGHQEPLPGHDLYLSLDARVQAVAERALRDGIDRARAQTFHSTGQPFRAPAGGVVLLDAKTGEVVAMASYPTYDPRKFVGGVDPEYFAELNDPAHHFPLLSRAAQAAYPPGSTIKPIMALAALASDVASPGGGYSCTTGFPFGDRVFHNWRPRTAVISLGQALVESCDTVFYRFAANWWAKERRVEKGGKRPYEIMQDWNRRFGLGRPTGIDLPVEASGNVPGRAQRMATWKKNRTAWCAQARKTHDVVLEDLCERGFLWRGGDAINLSIGQGELQVSPLQLAVAYGAIANGGKVMRPHLGMKMVAPSGKTARVVKPQVRGTVKLDPGDLAYVHRALARVPVVGTASFPFRGWPFSRISAAAKTGSAEIAGKQPFSWFAAYAPADGPRYVGAAVVEQAGFGSQVSGPVVRRIFDELFELPPTPIVFGTRSD